MNKELKEAISYLFFGVLAMLVSLFTYWLFNLLLGEALYLISNVLSWCITVAFAFCTNKIWVFASHDWSASVLKKELSGFLGARIFSLIMEEAGLWLLIDLLAAGSFSVVLFGITLTETFLAKVLMQFLVVLVNYLFSKFLIFKR